VSDAEWAATSTRSAGCQEKNPPIRRSSPTWDELRVAIVTSTGLAYRRRQARLATLSTIELRAIRDTRAALAASPAPSPSVQQSRTN